MKCLSISVIFSGFVFASLSAAAAAAAVVAAVVVGGGAPLQCGRSRLLGRLPASYPAEAQATTATATTTPAAAP